jgi:hypothetical protein
MAMRSTTSNYAGGAAKGRDGGRATLSDRPVGKVRRLESNLHKNRPCPYKATKKGLRVEEMLLMELTDISCVRVPSLSKIYFSLVASVRKVSFVRVPSVSKNYFLLPYRVAFVAFGIVLGLRARVEETLLMELTDISCVHVPSLSKIYFSLVASVRKVSFVSPFSEQKLFSSCPLGEEKYHLFVSPSVSKL